MYARQDMPISFPGLFGDREFNPSPIAIDIGNGIYWYGILICLGLLLAVLFCSKQAKKYGLTEDNVYDLLIWEIPLCVVGARLYYVIFYLDLYRNSDGSLNFSRMIAIWDGGLAIYGAIIVAFFVLLAFCRLKKLPFGAFADLGVMGLMIGQAVGRWGNFINREAFGGETSLPWRMRLWTSANEYIEVHPTFLYESLWNLVGLLLILFIVSRARTFDGENTCFYFIWYGLGRSVIEGLRTDSLYLFDLTLFGQPVRVSQALSLALVVAAFIVLLVQKRRHPHGQDALYVTKKEIEKLLAAEDAAKAASAQISETGAADAASAPAADFIEESGAETGAEPADASGEDTPGEDSAENG